MSHLLQRLRDAIPEASVSIDSIIQWSDDFFPQNQQGLQDYYAVIASKIEGLKEQFPQHSEVLDSSRDDFIEIVSSFNPHDDIEDMLLNAQMNAQQNVQQNAQQNSSPPGGEPRANQTRGGKRIYRFKKSKTLKSKNSKKSKTRKSKKAY
jgi:hypothetical protein